MKITNPTANDLNVQIQGVKYVLPANETITGVPTTHAEYWKVRLHEFIVIEEEVKEEEITLKSFTEKQEETIEETSQEPEKSTDEKSTDEKPKKTTTKKTK